MAALTVRYAGGERLVIRIRDHEVVSDQPVEEGGHDLGPTPTELFVASLAGCVAWYAQQYLRRHGVPADGVAVECDYEKEERPSRVAWIGLRVLLPEAFPEHLQERLLRVLHQCTVQNSLRTPPDVEIGLRSPAPVT